MSIDMPRGKFKDACRQIFDKIDTDSDGVLDKDEFTQFLASMMRAFDLPQDEIYKFLKSGKLNEDSILFKAFADIDTDGDGTLTFEEVWKGFEPMQKNLPSMLHELAAEAKLNSDMSDEEYNKMLEAMFNASDANQDGELDLVEFKDFVTRTMKAAGVSEAECQRAQANGEVGLWTNLFDEIDFDGDKRLTLPEIQEKSHILRARLPKDGGNLLYREMSIQEFEKGLKELFNVHDVNKDDKLDEKEFDKFMVNTMRASSIDNEVIEQAQTKLWTGMFDGLDFSEGKGLTWPEVWSKLAPMRAALPPLGGYKEKVELDSSSDSEDEEKRSFIQRTFDVQLARQAEDRAKN